MSEIQVRFQKRVGRGIVAAILVVLATSAMMALSFADDLPSAHAAMI